MVRPAITSCSYILSLWLCLWFSKHFTGSDTVRSWRCESNRLHCTITRTWSSFDKNPDAVILISCFAHIPTYTSTRNMRHVFCDYTNDNPYQIISRSSKPHGASIKVMNIERACCMLIGSLFSIGIRVGKVSMVSGMSKSHTHWIKRKKYCL